SCNRSSEQDIATDASSDNTDDCSKAMINETTAEPRKRRSLMRPGCADQEPTTEGRQMQVVPTFGASSQPPSDQASSAQLGPHPAGPFTGPNTECLDLRLRRQRARSELLRLERRPRPRVALLQMSP